jgi:hypothetical protein
VAVAARYPSSPRALWGGALLSALVAVALFTRFGIDGGLSRDESIYAYAGQQWAAGVAPYASIFDPKTPLASLLAGLGVLAGHAAGADGLDAIRVVFFAFACLTVVAIYLLGLELWESPLAGLAATVVLASFRGFAADALGGPDAKTPGIFLAVTAMLLLARRRWFWGAVAGALAFLVWQPLAVYALVALGAAPLTAEAGRRRRALAGAAAGAALPVALMTGYFWAAGALPQLVEATVRFPLGGVSRGHVTFAQRLADIRHVVATGYAHTGLLFWAGCLLFAVLAAVRPSRTLRDPYLCVALPTFLGLVAYSLTDFQGYPDLYPLLPYAALGLGGAAAVAVRRPGIPRLRQAASVGALAAVAVLAALSWHWYMTDPGSDHRLVTQRAHGAELDRLLRPGETLYALGDPAPLVLTHRRNPSRFIYLGSGISEWVVRHTPGGLAGWEARIHALNPAIVTIGGWKGPIRDRIERRLRRSYDARTLGRELVLLRRSGRLRGPGAITPSCRGSVSSCPSTTSRRISSPAWSRAPGRRSRISRS